MKENLFERYIKIAKKIVIKIGSAVLTGQDGLEKERIFDLCEQISELKAKGKKVIIVSSGAVAAGVSKMPERAMVKSVPEKQALAAIGQGLLMQVYEEAFALSGIRVAQILLTRDGLISRRRYVNAKNTIKTLVDWDVIPIINENDTVATEELQFTDNDALSVLVVNLSEADLLLSLSDINGLYDRDPRESSNARLIDMVDEIDDAVMSMAGEGPGRAGRGGMKSKLLSAKMVTSFGVPMIVAGGRERDVIKRIFSNEKIDCTLFLPTRKRKIFGRKPWIAFALEKKGRVYLDEGAVRALIEGGKSLLPAGIREVEGDFEQGECIVCMDEHGREVACGLTNYSSGDLKKISGCQTSEICKRIGKKAIKDEVIHRDDLVTLK